MARQFSDYTIQIIEDNTSELSTKIIAGAALGFGIKHLAGYNPDPVLYGLGFTACYDIFETGFGGLGSALRNDIGTFVGLTIGLGLSYFS